MTLDDQQKFINAVRKFGKDYERLAQETGKDKALLELFSKLLLAKIDESRQESLQDIADILRDNNSIKTTRDGSDHETSESQPTF